MTPLIINLYHAVTLLNFRLALLHWHRVAVHYLHSGNHKALWLTAALGVFACSGVVALLLWKKLAPKQRFILSAVMALLFCTGGYIQIAPAIVDRVVNADMFCGVAGTFDQTCFTNAQNALPAGGGEIHAAARTYTFTGSFQIASGSFLFGDSNANTIITGDPGNAALFNINNASSTVSGWGVTGFTFNNTHTPTSDNNWACINAKGSNDGWIEKNIFIGCNVGVSLQQTNRGIWIQNNKFNGLFTGAIQDATNYQTVTAASTDGATATLTCAGQCNAKVNEIINVVNCSATPSLNTNISSISGSVISFGATVTAVGATTVSYANTTGAGTPAATGCQVSIQSQDIHENFNNIYGSTGAGISGPAHDVGDEDTSNLEIIGNQIQDGAGWTTANSSPIQVFMNKAAAIQNVVVKGNRVRALPSQASNATGIQCMGVDSNGNYLNQIFEANTCDGYKDGIEATGVGIINSQYKNNAFRNVSLGVVVDGPSSSRTIVASTGCSESGNTATCSTTVAHLFQAGELVAVAGVGTAGFNGTWMIGSVQATSFTFTDPATGLATGGGGTAIVTQVHTDLQVIGNNIGSVNGNIGSQRGLEYLNVDGLISKDNKIYLSQGEGERVAGVSRSVFSDYILNSGEAGSNKIAVYCLAQGTQNSLSNVFINPMAGSDEWGLGQTPNTNQPIRLDAGCVNSKVNGYALYGSILRAGELTDNGVGTQFNDANRMTGYGAWTLKQVVTPAAPTVSAQGSGGATTWTYAVACLTGNLLSPWSTTASATNIASLSSTSFNLITVPQTAGCEAMRVCRTAVGTSPSTSGYFASVMPGQVIFDDGSKPNGDGSACNSSTNNTGQLTAPALISGGTQSISGCTLNTNAGGASAGKFVSGATSCTVTVTFPFPAPNGWECEANDLTTTTDSMKQSATTTTTATITGTTVIGDVINYSCGAY